MSLTGVSLTVSLLLALPLLTAYAQGQGKPGWRASGANRDQYEMGIDSTVAHTGHSSGFIRSKSSSSSGWATFMQSFDAAPYAPGRLSLSAYIRTKEATGAAMWMRVDGPNGALALDNMQDRPIRGTSDWTLYHITLDVPPDAKAIALGLMLHGSGQAWIDDVSLEKSPLDSTGGGGGAAGRGKIGGVVRGPSGHPVPDAVVAAVTAFDVNPTATVRSGRDGRFQFPELAPNSYGITATAPGLEAGFLGKVRPETKERDLEIVLKEGGHTFRGVVHDSQGRPCAGIPVLASRFSEMSGDLFCTLADSAGRYSLTLPSGYKYFLGVQSDVFDLAAPTLEADQDRVADLDLQPMAQAPAAAEVVGWVRDHAIRLTSPRAGHGLADMEPIRDLVGDAHLVCLGEATHGTREFFQLKHRMLEFLAERMGFTVFGIEATFPEGFDVNRYVLTGEGDPAEVLKNLYFWTWNTEEVLDMIRWMRAYNQDPSHVRKLKFYGFDMQFPAHAAQVALDYIRRVDPSRADSAGKVLDLFVGGSGRFESLSPEEKTAATASVASLLATFDTDSVDDSRRSTSGEWDLARQHLRVVHQYCDMIAGGTAHSSVRDRAMAENIRWILGHEGPGTKMVVWAHNGHVSTGEDQQPGNRPMGSYLREALGRDMVVFGFCFNQGSFQAVDFRPGQKGLKNFTVAPEPEGSLGRTLAEAGLSLAALDLRALPPRGPVADWFAAPHRMRSIGAVYSPTSDKAYLGKVRVTTDFDALLFVENTTAAVPVEPPASPATYAPAAVNLDFESGPEK